MSLPENTLKRKLSPGGDQQPDLKKRRGSPAEGERIIKPISTKRRVSPSKNQQPDSEKRKVSEDREEGIIKSVSTKHKASEDEGQQPDLEKRLGDEGQQPETKKQKVSRPKKHGNDHVSPFAAVEQRDVVGDETSGSTPFEDTNAGSKADKVSPAGRGNKGGREHGKKNDKSAGDEKKEDQGTRDREDPDDGSAKAAAFQLIVREAQALFAQLVLLVEMMRCALEQGEGADSNEWQHLQIEKVCDLAAQPGVASNLCLSRLPGHWFTDIQRLRSMHRRTNDLEEQLRTCMDEVSRSREAFSKAVLERTEILHVAPDDDLWPATAKEQGRLASQARADLRRAEAERAALERQIVTNRKLEQSLLITAMSAAEGVLIDVDLVSAPKVIRKLLDEPTAEPSIPPIDNPPQPRAAIPRRGDAMNAARSTHAGPTQPEERAIEPPRSLNDIIREENAKALRDAAQAWTEAEQRFDAIRDGYGERFASFLDARLKGHVIGSETDFDKSYYLDRSKASHDLGVAKDRYRFARREARRVGAIPRHQLTSDYGDWSDDGYDDASDYGRRHPGNELARELKIDAIEKWKRDLEVEDDTGNMVKEEDRHDLESGGKSLADVSVTSLMDVAVGKHRTRIDKWTAHQEKLRAALGPIPLEDALWFQEFSGM
ncbi:hypothetical protein LTR37_018445 [Vermiconidia calcicola]|uniref:Uncharacterized protein n=1 Tax=Vermiconidia calcicola TaxID=1690605 RepID=A0ACC3MH30_9PEZI|nr:hypothetical protein LTR37_018445 [Vermiconidia calcicola]